MPAGPAASPRGGPGRGLGLAVLVRLPEREVARVPLAGVGVGVAGRLQVVEPLAGELPVLREGTDVEVHVAVDGVGVAALDQPLHERDHVGHVPGGARLVGRRQDAEDVVGAGAGALVLERPGPPRDAVLGGLGEDLVVDVGDVPDVGHVEAAGRQPAAQHVEGQRGADVADVRRSLHGEPADVDRRPTGTQGREVADRTGGRVVQAEAHWRESTERAVRPVRPRGTAPSGPPARWPPPPGPRRGRSSPSPSVVVPVTLTGAPSAADSAASASARRGPSRGVVAISWTEALPTRQPAAVSTSRTCSRTATPRGAGPAGVVGAEQPADVAEPRGGEHGVGERVRDDVAVGVAGAAVDARPVQAGDRARPTRLDRVDVGADPDPGQVGLIAPPAARRARGRARR